MLSVADRRSIELTIAQAATIAGVKPHTVSVWVIRGHVRRTAHGKIDGGSLIDYLDRRGDRGQHTRWSPPR